MRMGGLREYIFVWDGRPLTRGRGERAVGRTARTRQRVAASGDGRPSRSGSQGEVGAGGAKQGPVVKCPVFWSWFRRV
jgi:hypothetical protein